MGFGRALGLAVFAYTNRSLAFTQRTALALGGGAVRDERGRLCDFQHMAVEEWGLMDNLMLEGGVQASGGALVVEEAPAGEEFTFLGGFKKCVRLAALALLLAASSAAAADKPKQPAPAFPLKAADGGRYLVDQNGVPFLIAGESPRR